MHSMMVTINIMFSTRVCPTACINQRTSRHLPAYTSYGGWGFWNPCIFYITELCIWYVCVGILILSPNIYLNWISVYYCGHRNQLDESVTGITWEYWDDPPVVLGLESTCQQTALKWKRARYAIWWNTPVLAIYILFEMQWHAWHYE